MSPLPPATERSETSGGAYGQFSLFVDRDRELTGQIPAAGAWLSHRPTRWMRLLAGAEVAYLEEVRMEQAFLELAPDPAFGVRAGLLLLPLGIINQWHLPNTYLTVDRPLTDQLIIPTTWRELGVELFGALGEAARYQLQLVAGLDAAGFSAVAPLRGGRGNAGGIGAHDAAVVGRLELGALRSGFALGASGYWGGASGGHAQLDGVDVGLAEVDLRYTGGGFDLRAEAAELFIVNSYQVNDYLGLLGQDAVPARGRGFYAQVAYDVLYTGEEGGRRPSLLFFAGFEGVNPRSKMSRYNFNPATITGPGETPPNAPSPNRAFVHGGLVFRPVPAIAIKADAQFALDPEAPAPLPPAVTPGAPGTPVSIPSAVLDAARGRTRVGFALAFGF